MSSQPNIIFILTDDQGAWAMGCAGNKEIQTPNQDAIAAQGIRFDNYFCVSPVCSPARASLLTGRIPSAHGVHDWIQRGNMLAVPGLPIFSGDDCAIEYLKSMHAYTETLAENGYTMRDQRKVASWGQSSPAKKFYLLEYFSIRWQQSLL